MTEPIQCGPLVLLAATERWQSEGTKWSHRLAATQMLQLGDCTDHCRIVDSDFNCKESAAGMEQFCSRAMR